MDEKLQILLGSCQNVDSVNVDNYQRIELENKPAQILEYDVKNALSATEIFDAEREANDVYRIYGRIEYLSLLNGLKLDYLPLQDFFLQQKINCKTIFNSFNFYLLKAASSGYTKTISGISTIDYVRYFEVIATQQDFELYNAGFTTNVYGDQVYSFNFNRDFDVTPYVDNFGFPATELFLYAEYKPGVNGNSMPETMQRTNWNTSGTKTKVSFTPTTLNYGSRVYGDLIEYSKSLFYQSQLEPQTYYITTPYTQPAITITLGTFFGVPLTITIPGGNYNLVWKYNPIIPLRLRYFYDKISNANTGSTSYAQSSTIPYYATEYPAGTGNYVWRDIIPQGNIDPLTGVGVDYPFINMRRYLFSPIILDVKPNLDDAHTLQVFSEIQYGVPTLLNTNPNTDLDNIGKPCL